MNQTQRTATASAATPTQASARHRIESIIVLYDQNCPVCRTAHRWVERQSKLVPVTFIPAGSDAARHHFPDLDVRATLSDITVIDNTGAVYRGDQAWLVVLWCLRRTRRLANDLSQNRRRWAFHNVVNATELIRKLSRTNDATPRNTPLPAPRYPAQPYPTYPTYPTVQNPQPRYWQQPYPYQQYTQPQPAAAARAAAECERCHE